MTLRITVDTAVSTYDATCQTWCAFRYREYSTPRISAVASAVASDTQLSIWGDLLQREASNFAIRVGNSSCLVETDMNSPADPDVSSSASDSQVSSSTFVRCSLPETAAGATNLTVRIDCADGRGCGTPEFPRTSYNVDTRGNVFHTKVVPVVRSISASTSSPAGGNLVTIRGSGFHAGLLHAHDITVAGMPCTVRSASDEELVCETQLLDGTQVPAHTFTAAGQPWTVGGRGLTSRKYYSRNLQGSSSACNVQGSLMYETDEPDEQRVMLAGLQTSVTENLYEKRTTYYGESLQGYFVPPVSGEYQFAVAADDAIRFLWAEDGMNTSTMACAAYNTYYNTMGVFEQVDAQWTPKRAFTAGEPVFVSMEMFQYSGSGYGYAAARLHNYAVPGVATPEGDAVNVDALQATAGVRPRQVIRVYTAAQRQTIELRFFGADPDGTVFGLREAGVPCDGDERGNCPWAALGLQSSDASAIRTAVGDITGCGSVSASRDTSRIVSAPSDETSAEQQARLNNYGVTWTVVLNCPKPAAGWPQLSISNRVRVAIREGTVSGTFSASTEVTQQASEPLGGSFTVTWGGQTTGPIAITSSWGTVSNRLHDALQALPNIDIAVVSKGERSNGNCLDGCAFTVVQETGAVSTVAAATVDLASVTGYSPQSSVVVVDAGDLTTLHFDVAPADWFRVAQPLQHAAQGTVELSVAGIQALCADNTSQCLFEYMPQASAPTVSAVSSSANADGSVSVTITGAGLRPGSAQDPAVLLGGANATCDSVSFASSAGVDTVACTVATAPAGSWPVQVRVDGIGFALLAGGALTDPLPSVAVPLQLNSMAPAQGSVMGGTRVALTGQGFHAGATAVQIGGAACSDVQVQTANTLTCVTPAAGSGRRLADSAANVTVSAAGLSAAGAPFQFAEASTPEVTAVSPTAVSYAVTTTLTLTMAGSWNPNQVSALAVKSGAGETERICVNPRVVAGTSDVQCDLIRGQAPAAAAQSAAEPLRVTVAGFGAARLTGTAAAGLDAKFVVNGVSAGGSGLVGSLLGGQELTFDVEGFVDGAASITDAYVEVPGWDELHHRIACTVTSVAATQVKCVTDPVAWPQYPVNVPHDVVTGALTLRLNRLIAPCAGSCSFSFRADAGLSATASLDAGSATITATLSNTPIEPVKAWVAGVPCPGTLAGAVFTCTQPALPAGDHVLTLSTARGTVNVTAGSSVTTELQIDAMPYSVVSKWGGAVVQVTGRGFSNITEDNRFEFNGRRATILSSAADMVVVQMPYISGGANPMTLRVRVLDAVSRLLAADETVTTTMQYSSADSPWFQSVATTVSGAAGHAMTLAGQNLGNGTSYGSSVSVAGVAATVTSWTPTSISLQLPALPAGAHDLVVRVGNYGEAVSSKMIVVDAPALAVSGAASGGVSVGGGAVITLTPSSGHGLPAVPTLPLPEAEVSGSQASPACGALPAAVQVCGKDATVLTSASGSMTVQLPWFMPASALSVAADAFLPGTLEGTPQESGAYVAFDGDVSVGVSKSRVAMGSVCSLTLDLGAAKTAAVSRVRWYSIWKQAEWVLGTVFEGSSDGVAWHELGTVQGRPTEGWNYFDFTPADAGADDWEGAAKWRYLRWRGARDTGCSVTEVDWIGYSADVVPAGGRCPITVTSPCGDADGSPAAFTVNGDVAYTVAGTPLVTRVDPAFGSSNGGDTITVYGSGFKAGATQVELAGGECTVASVAADGSSLTCQTSARPGYLPPTIRVSVDGVGNAAVHAELAWRYLDRWSAVNTWKWLEPPVEDDFVVIPEGQSILFDTSIKLTTLLVEGELIWERADGHHLQAKHIVVHGGRFEIGTPDVPFTNTATITLHGDRYKDIELPRVGTKVLAVMERGARAVDGTGAQRSDPGPYTGRAVSEFNRAVLDIHGIPRARVWTRIAQDAGPGDTQLVMAEDIDWAVGDQLVIASSDVEWDHAEVVTVTGTGQPSASRPGTWRQVTFTPPLRHLHRAQLYDATEYGHGVVDMRAEVGLLSRNIVIQGDESSPKQRFGAHTMAAGGGTYRLENAEVRNCGQSFILGRYCTHAHMAGEFSRSYVSAMSVHNSFQRMATIHGVKHYRVQHSVGYNIRGHSVFVEDGAEAFNVIENNLVIGTQPCSACIASDTKPASFWAASPKQIWLHNVAAGCTNDGYWHELPGNPHGPSYTTDICPVHDHLGEFFNNSAHSNGVHGLRLYPLVQPFVDPCGEARGAPQIYRNFTAYRCGQHGIFGKKNGDVHHYGARLLENRGSDGFWKILTDDVPYRPHTKPIWDGWGPTPELGTAAIPQYYASLFVGTTRPDFNPATDGFGKVGLWMPQNERFFGAKLTFVNYGQTGAIAGCADCDDPAFMKQGGYTYRLTGLRFVQSPVRVRWTVPYKSIMHDLDGSLTGRGPRTWALPYYKFNQHAACREMPEGSSLGGGQAGMSCDSSVGVRRLLLDRVEPGWKLDRKYIALSQTDPVPGLTEEDTTDGIAFRARDFWGWSVPLVTVPGTPGRFYNMWWYADKPSVPHPTDWEEARVAWSYEPLLNETELPQEWLGLRLNWTYRRYSVASMYTPPSGVASLVQVRGEPVLDPLLEARRPDHADILGTGWVDRRYDPTGEYTNNTYYLAFTRHFLELDGGQNPAVEAANRVQLVQIQCAPGECRGPRTDIERTPFRWSQSDTWAALSMSGPPAAGSDFTVPDWVELTVDVNPPALHHVRVEGALVFDPSARISMQVAAIAIWGELIMGTVDNPVLGHAELLVTGQWGDDTMIVGEGVDSDTKGVIVLGNLTTCGITKPSQARLAADAPAGATQLVFSESMLAWRAGDKLVMPPGVGQSPSTWQIVTVAETRDVAQPNVVPIVEPLDAAHVLQAVAPGAGAATAPSAQIAPAVGLLTNNVVIRGSAEAGDYVYKRAAPGKEGAAVGGPAVGFGVHITVGDPVVPYTDSTGKSVQQRYAGKVDMQFTTVQHAGWSGAEHPALYLRYRNGDAPANSLNRVAFWGLENRGLRVLNAANLTVRGCLFHASEDFGIEIPDEFSPGAVLENNLFIGMKRAPDTTTLWHSPSATVFTRSATKSLVNNVVYGALDTGVAFMPRACDASDVATAQVGNVVIGSLVGAWPLTLERGPNCVDVRGWTLVGARHIGLLTLDQTAEVHARDMVIADAHIGVHMHLFRSAARTYLRLESSTVVATLGSGTTDAVCSGAPLCNSISEDDVYGTSSCQSGVGRAGVWRVGVLAPQLDNRAKTCAVDHEDIVPEDCYPYNTVTRLCSLPYDKRYGLPSTRHAELHLTDVAFVGFKSRTCAGTGAALGDNAGDKLGFRAAAYAGNPLQPDFSPPVHMSRITWTDVDDEARFWIHATGHTPDCDGGCDAFNQALIRDLDGTALRVGDDAPAGQPSLLVTHPALFARQPDVTCDDQYQAAWGGAACRASVAGSGAARIVAGVTENIDRDRGHRRIGPIDTRLQNQVEAFPAHGPGDDSCAMRFFFGQYPQLWHVGTEVVMNVTATMPARFRMHYFSESSADATRVALWTRRPFDLMVFHGSTQSSQVKTLDTAAALADNLPTLADPAGTLLFSPQHVTAWVILRGSPGSPSFTVAQQPSIRLSMTLAVSPEEFYGDNIVKNMAVLLGINEAQIKVADVTAGSTRVMLVITSDTSKLSVPSGDPDNTKFDEYGSAASALPGEDTHLEALASMYDLSAAIQSARDSGELDTAIGYEVLAMDMETTSDGRESLPQPAETEEQSATSSMLVAILIAGVVGAVLVVIGVASYRRFATANARRVLDYQVQGSNEDGRTDLISNPVGRHPKKVAAAALPSVTDGPSASAVAEAAVERRGSYQRAVWAPTQARDANRQTKGRKVQNHRGEFIISPN